ncbi:DUF6340 family protein [Carboxylicivirga caseinilyticus]|uniref:DUF6340 family protein n=1 Tax=Carboxylicivirga caseinilyticus TaxID=3417572 RepID=UPI003D337FBF|nr:hypothetical protein [Marinilabiliaceae bacterium A049]
MMKYTLSLILAVLLVACSSTSSIISYEILRPAKYTVPPEVKSVVLINNSYPYERKDIHIANIDGQSQVLDTSLFVGYPDSVLVSLRHSLLYKNFFDTVYYDTIHYKKVLPSNPIEKLSEEQIKNICGKYNADAVLALEAYVYGTKLELENHPEICFSTLGVYGFNYWRMYDGYTYESIISEMQKDTIYWYGDGYNMDVSLIGFPTLEKANTEFAFYMGDEFSGMMVPEWERIERNLFIKGNSYFVEANEWLGKNNTDEARKLWGYIYEKGKELEKARAAHNIAVTLEREGDINNALIWAFKSYEVYKRMMNSLYKEESEDAKNYYVYLTHRKNEIIRLDEQVGGG